MPTTDKVGLNESEYLALVERIQKAMCIEPFRPDVTDVVVLIGTVQVLNQEVERLREALRFAVRRHRTSCACQACEVFWGGKREQVGTGGAWADLQSETEAIDGDQVL